MEINASKSAAAPVGAGQAAQTRLPDHQTAYPSGSPIGGLRSMRPAELTDVAAPPPFRLLHQQALVIGVGAYLDANIKPLANAPADARALADLLREDYGFELLPGDAALLDGDATQAAIERAVRKCLAQASETTRWLFYFAGHGAVIDGKACLLPADAGYGQVGSCLLLDSLIQACKESACAEILIILDACYAGKALVRQDELDDLLPANDPGERVIQIVTSGNPDEPVLDGGGGEHSVFTQSLLEALAGWAGIHEKDGEVRFTRLLDQLVFDVAGRLIAAGQRSTRQRPVGGYLRRSSQGQSDFTLQPIRPRLNPQLVQNARSDDPRWRENAMDELARIADQTGLSAAIVDLAAAHTHRDPDAPASFLVAGFRNWEPQGGVRARAARTLGELPHPASIAALLAALDDEPRVCRAAAAALGGLRYTPAAGRLFERLRSAPDELFLDLIYAIGSVGDPGVNLSALRLALHKEKLIPVIGPDFRLALTGAPSRADFIADLAQQAGVQPAPSLAKLAAQVSQDGQALFTLTKAMKDAYDDPFLKPGRIYQALAQLGAPFWVSLAYDNLLVRALNANAIVMGADTLYWRPERKAVVRLSGDVSSLRGRLALEQDYEVLREDEGDRRLLVNYLRQQLEGKVLLFMGFDPFSPDFDLLVKHILNGHLANLEARAFLVSEQPAEDPPVWSGRRLHPLAFEPLGFIQALNQAGSETPPGS